VLANTERLITKIEMTIILNLIKVLPPTGLCSMQQWLQVYSSLLTRDAGARTITMRIAGGASLVAMAHHLSGRIRGQLSELNTGELFEINHFARFFASSSRVGYE